MDDKFQDRIDNFLLHNNDMSEADKVQFLQEIEADDEKRAQFEFTKDVKMALKSRNKKLKAMATFEKEYKQQHRMVREVANAKADGARFETEEAHVKLQSKSRNRKRWMALCGIAAVLLIGFFVTKPLFFYQNESPLQRGNGDVFETTKDTNHKMPRYKSKESKTPDDFDCDMQPNDSLEFEKDTMTLHRR